MGFWECAAYGAEIGFKVFFAIGAFALCVLGILAVVGLLGLLAKWAGYEGEDKS